MVELVTVNGPLKVLDPLTVMIELSIANAPPTIRDAPIPVTVRVELVTVNGALIVDGAESVSEPEEMLIGSWQVRLRA